MILYELIMHVYETPGLCASPAKMERGILGIAEPGLVLHLIEKSANRKF
jgi:hypothetical protein